MNLAIVNAEVNVYAVIPVVNGCDYAKAVTKFQ
jgi:hypothetical protein